MYENGENIPADGNGRWFLRDVYTLSDANHQRVNEIIDSYVANVPRPISAPILPTIIPTIGENREQEEPHTLYLNCGKCGYPLRPSDVWCPVCGPSSSSPSE